MEQDPYHDAAPANKSAVSRLSFPLAFVFSFHTTLNLLSVCLIRACCKVPPPQLNQLAVRTYHVEHDFNHDASSHAGGQLFLLPSFHDFRRFPSSMNMYDNRVWFGSSVDYILRSALFLTPSESELSSFLGVRSIQLSSSLFFVFDP
jgi:hypothetical protein